MKEKILTLLREMTNDSKSASHKAERELCSILTEVINKLRTIEENANHCIKYYPDKIDSIEECCWYSELPKEIECNDGDFCFYTEWLDINYREYFETLKKNTINSVKNRIFRIEYSLLESKKDLEHIENLKFEDLEI